MTFDEIFGEKAAEIQALIDAKNAAIEDKSKQIKLVDLSTGDYVSKGKYTDQLAAKDTTIADLTAQIAKRDSDSADLIKQLDALKNADDELKSVKESFTALQEQNKAEAEKHAAEMKRQAYEFMVREKSNELEFSSNSAKKAFLADAIAKNFAMENDTLLGFGDFVETYKAQDPGAFKTAEPPASGKKFTSPSKGQMGSGKKMTVSEMMAAKNADPNFVINFDD